MLVWLGVLFLVYVLLAGVGLIGDGFKLASGGAAGAERIFAFASNPIVGVILGILATALVQSSSTVSSVIVGLVAGGVPVSVAVPMIMGANMGTTITNTIVSLGSISERGTFRKSFQAATVHDFFNLFSIVVFLPIEMLFHPLERSAETIAGWFVGGDAERSVADFNVLSAVTRPVSDFTLGVLDPLPANLGGIIGVLIGIGLVVLSVLQLGRLLREVMTGRARTVVDLALGRGPLMGITSGTVVTVLVQSSSTTTSLVVPLAGTGVITIRQVFPFTMGANIGTCITALLAATAISGAGQFFALQVALVHLLYNVIGVLVFLTIPVLKDLPVRCAQALGNRVEENRFWAFGYVFAVFFLLPGAVFAGEYLFGAPEEEIRQAREAEEAKQAEEGALGEGLIID